MPEAVLMDTFTVGRMGCIERADNGYTAEASDLGLPVGVFPDHLIVPGLGAFTRAESIRGDGEITDVLYTSNGVVLTVWND
jgi:hypothetical protein